MKIRFLPYPLAMIAKEKGFNEDCFRFYNEKGLMQNVQMNHDCISAPLYQQIQDWFRDVHGLSICAEWFTYPKAFIYKIDHCKNMKFYKSNVIIGYYEAIDKAIEESFKLIP